MDKGNVEFEFPARSLVVGSHVRGGRALALAAGLPSVAAMFKSYRTGMWPGQHDLRDVFIEISQHFALVLDIRALKHNGDPADVQDRPRLTLLQPQTWPEIKLQPPKIEKKNPEFFPPGPTPQVQDGAGYILSVILTSHLSPHI